MIQNEVKIGDAPIEIIDGDRGLNYPKQNELMEEGYCLFLSAKNVTIDGFRFEEKQFISKDKDLTLGKGKVFRDDIILTTRGTLGNVAWYEDSVEFNNIRINSGMVLIRPNGLDFTSEFLYAFFRSRKFKDQVRALQSGSAQPQLPVKDIKKIKIPMLSLSAQKGITKIISNYDKLIQNNRQRINLLESTAFLLYREWFSKFQKSPKLLAKDTFMGDEEFFQLAGGGTPSTKKANYWDNGDIIWVTQTDITNSPSLVLLDSAKRITPEGLANSSATMVPANSILMTSVASVGFFGIIDQEVCTNQGCINISPRRSEYRYFVLLNLISRVSEIRNMASGTTYSMVSKGRFKQLPISIPPAKDLNWFHGIISPIFDQMRNLEKQNLELRQARDLLLPRLMDGRIKP